MSYEILFIEDARKALKKMDAATSGIITSWIKKNLISIDDPRRNGKALTGDPKGIWRYRIGDHRILAKIDDGRLIILILVVGHWYNIYD